MPSDDELRAAQNAIAQAMAQHSAYTYRASSTVVNAINAQVDSLARTLAAELTVRLDELNQAEMQAFLAGKYNTDRLKDLRDSINQWAASLNTAVYAEWTEPAKQLAGYEVGYITSLMGEVVQDVPAVSLTANQVYRSAMVQPVLGQLVDDMLKGIASDTKDRVYSTVRQGMSAGQSNAQIIKALRGTSALNWSDGVLQATKNDAGRIVRTARNHISNVAYESTYDALGVKYMVVCATLDGRTSKYCAQADGTIYKVGDQFPRPPYHPNCRTVLAPSVDGELIGKRPFVRSLKVRGRDGESKFRSIGDMTKKQREQAGLEVGQVAATTNYGTWFGNQDAAFQQEWLGPSRYELYKKGDYTLERFIDPLTGKQYNLEQLRAKDAQTFQQVFGD